MKEANFCAVENPCLFSLLLGQVSGERGSSRLKALVPVSHRAARMSKATGFIGEDWARGWKGL